MPALSLLPILLASGLLSDPALACTNVLVTPGASSDSSTFITYAADSHHLYGFLSHKPAADHPKGSTRKIFVWDTGDPLGEIEEVPHTYAVIGNMNEHQLAIGETTFGGREELVDPLGGIDYGSLIYIALERARTAREAIDVMTSLVARYGYWGAGESFSISDPREAWILEMVGKGPGGKGALWVARKIPDGFISAHANQARIQDFPLDDKKNTLFAPDVVSFAREKGWFQGSDSTFKFAETYSPPDFGAIRACEARVWSVFNRAAPSLKIPAEIVRGDSEGRLPLWVKPDHKLSLHDTMELMRDHFEDSPYDLRLGVGAGPFACPYRWRPMEWKSEGTTYIHERAISTQQTGFSFVAQSRASLPDLIGGVLWFGVDDTYSTVYMPFWSGVLQVPHGLSETTADLFTFSWDSTFWVFNHVSNLAYTRYSDMILEIRAEQQALEGSSLADQPEIEKAALTLHSQSPRLAREYLTHQAIERADTVHARWRKLGEHLMVKYLDGNVKAEHHEVKHPDYPEAWRKTIAANEGPKVQKLKVPGAVEPKNDLPIKGWFHSAEELGALKATIPADFPWSTHKLVLKEGKNLCKAPPRCCVEPQRQGDALIVTTPEPTPADPCGTSDWWVKVPKDERLPLRLP